MDAVDAKTLSRLMKKLEKKSGAPVLAMSGATGEGLERVLDRLAAIIGEKTEEPEGEAKPWTPDRKGVVSGQRVYVRVDLGGGRISNRITQAAAATQSDN